MSGVRRGGRQSEREWVSHETLPVRNDRLIEFWVSYRSSLLQIGESCIAL